MSACKFPPYMLELESDPEYEDVEVGPIYEKTIVARNMKWQCLHVISYTDKALFNKNKLRIEKHGPCNK